MDELLVHSAVTNTTLLLLLGALVGFALRVLAERISHKELFDHRLRLEKEYGIYSDLWDKLFEFRRAAGNLVNSLGRLPQEDPFQVFVETFDRYQAVVRKGEPFIHPTIYRPAREIVKLGHEIDTKTKQIKRLEKMRSKRPNGQSDEKLADKEIETDETMQATFDEIEKLFVRVCEAIRKRIMLKP